MQIKFLIAKIKLLDRRGGQIDERQRKSLQRILPQGDGT
jgi:hypothetical protein